MTAMLDHQPEATPEGRPARSGCCNPRPWQPICVGCPDRRFAMEDPKPVRYVRDASSCNPYASLDEVPPRYVDVELPDLPGGES